MRDYLQLMKIKLKLFLRFIISAILLAAVFKFGGLEDFKGILGKMKWELIIPLILLNFLLIFLFGYRWWFFLEKKLTLKESSVATTIGLGANMILPARGGDLLRVYHSIRHGETGVHLVLARLFMEKILDIVVVLLVGCSALAMLGLYENSIISIYIFLLVAFLLAGIVILLKWRSETLARFTHSLFGAVRLGFLFDRYIHQFFHEIRNSISRRKLIVPVLTSLALWLIPYAAFYMICAGMVSINLSYLESLVLLLAGAIGLAIPAAPSGIGTFHAAIASGFVLIGRPLSEGVLLATVIHASMFIGLLIPAAIAYPFSSGGNPGLPTNHKELGNQS